MVKYILSEAPNGWNVSRFGDGVKTIATVKTEGQARLLAEKFVCQEKQACVIRIDLNGSSSVVEMFSEETTQSHT